MTTNYIQERIRTAPNLDFGNIFSESIDLFKKSIIHGFVMEIIIMIATLPFLMLFYLPLIMASIAQEGYVEYGHNPYGDMISGISILSFFLFFIGMLVIGVFVMAIRAGFVRMLARIDDEMDVSTKELFYFFKTQFLWKSFLLLLLMMLISTVAILLLILPIFYVIVPLSFFLVVFAFNPELKVAEILSLSFLLGNKKWLISFGLIILSSILASMVGFLLCGIGVLFTAPFIYHPLYIIYKKLIGFEEIPINGTFKNTLRERF